MRRVENHSDGLEGCFTDDTDPVTPLSVVQRELAWRMPRVPRRCTEPVIASRWTSPAVGGLIATTPPCAHIVAIFLRATRGVICVDGRPWHAGAIPAGTAVVTIPEQQVAAEFFEPVDSLHLRMDNAFVAADAELAREIAATPLQAGIYRDEAVDKLARALLATHDAGCMTRCAESLGKPIVARLRHLSADGARRHPDQHRGMLQNWRLVKVTHYVDANLGKRITLADIARAAGLSPMHFAARFRAATGQKPHEYLQLCRIERAKRLLAEGNRSLIDIAMEVGFRTQAHFTTVFKRFAGRTPHSWRTGLHD